MHDAYLNIIYLIFSRFLGPFEMQKYTPNFICTGYWHLAPNRFMCPHIKYNFLIWLSVSAINGKNLRAANMQLVAGYLSQGSAELIRGVIAIHPRMGHVWCSRNFVLVSQVPPTMLHMPLKKLCNWNQVCKVSWKSNLMQYTWTLS